MKIDTMKAGERYRLRGTNAETNKPSHIDFTIVEIIWYPSPVKPAVLMRGAKVRNDSGGEAVLFFLELEFCERIPEQKRRRS